MCEGRGCSLTYTLAFSLTSLQRYSQKLVTLVAPDCWISLVPPTSSRRLNQVSSPESLARITLVDYDRLFLLNRGECHS